MREFGLQLFSVRDKLTTECEVKETFMALSKMGYTTAQTAGTYDFISAEKFKEYADAAGIEMCGTHYSYDLIKNDIEGTVKYHNTIGAKIIGVGGAPSMAVYATKESLLAFIDEYNKLAEIYAARGFKLSFHNHATEGIKLDGKCVFEYMIENFSENVTFCFDTYWAQHAGLDVVHTIERLSGRLDILHLKDMEAFVSYELLGGRKLHAPRYVEVGRGNLDFKRICEAAERAGTKYFIVEDEYYSTGNSLDSVKMSADYIKENLIK